MKLILAFAVAMATLLSACGTGPPPPVVTVTVGSPAGVFSEQAGPPRASSATRSTTTTESVPAGPQSRIATDGTYLVGTDIYPGVYRTPGGSSCYWARLSSLDTSDIIDNNNSSGPQVIEILPTDRAFLTERCQAWTLASAPGHTAVTPTVIAPDYPVAYKGLTCSYRAALTLTTTLSAVVVCQEATGGYVYKGLRLKDNARIDVPGAVPTANGFTAINNGTRYEVSAGGLVIYADGEVFTEPAVAP